MPKILDILDIVYLCHGESQESNVLRGKRGHIPLIYTSWKDALEQVNGYRGAIFQSFSTEKDAERFIAATAKEKNKSTAAKRSDHKETFGKGTENDVSNEDNLQVSLLLGMNILQLKNFSRLFQQISRKLKIYGHTTTLYSIL